MKSRALVLLSGEGITIPMAEARALFLTYDVQSTFESPDPQLLIARTSADPFLVGSRIAFARRVGHIIERDTVPPEFTRGRRVRFRSFDLEKGLGPADPEKYLKDSTSSVDLLNPEFELTLVRGSEDYLAVTSPMTMRQAWSTRRPRKRAFFHPAAIFPKLSRALVNMSRCREEEVFLDPFAGTGSIPMEAAQVGSRVVAIDLSEKMSRGALSNMNFFDQKWMGVVRADSTRLPLSSVDAVATDPPYGRASSGRGRNTGEILELLVPALGSAMKPGAIAVVMHPQEVPIQGTGHFSVVEEHQLHVHKRLTRTVSVLRRD